MAQEQVTKDLSLRMDSAVNVLDDRLRGLRTGRASVNLLDPVQVDAYGSRLPLPQVATISVGDARTLNVQVWDKGMVKTVEKAISDSNLGLTPNSDGQIIRINLPILTEDRRKELASQARKYGEETKIAIRNIRQSGNEEIKKLEKDKKLTEDEHRKLSEEIQKLTEEFNKKIDVKISQKEKEIMTV